MGWIPGIYFPSPGSSSGYYVGICRYEITKCYLNGGCVGYYNGSYYYAGSGQACNFPVICGGTRTEYFFGYVSSSSSDVKSSSNYTPFAPKDQQGNPDYKYFGVFYTYYWFAPDQRNPSNLDVYFLVNGNIYNHALPKEQYTWGCGWFGCTSANAITPKPPTYMAESYKNAYETAFEAEGNISLNNYMSNVLIYDSLPLEFINGTFAYRERYPGVPQINYLINNMNNYNQQPYLFISAGSGGGSGFMYLN